MKKLGLLDDLLLDYMVFYPIPFFALFNPERLNKPAIGLNIEAISSHLALLSKNDLIVISAENGKRLELSEKTIYFVLKQAFGYHQHASRLTNLRKRLFVPKKFIYPMMSLTRSGAEEWERFFKPDWSKFCLESESFGEIGGKRKIVFEAQNKDVVQESSYMTLKYITSYSSKWEEIRPWKPFYWKKFELGHALEISFLEDGMDIEFSSEDTEKLRKLRKWKKEWNQNGLEGLY